jgi:cullin 3
MPPRKKIVIPKFKTAAADTDAMWTVLDSAIKQIFAKEQSKLSYEVLYRNAYNMVLHKQGETLYQNVRRVVATHLTAQAQAITRCNAGDFMGELQQQWKDFKLAITMVRDVCIYLDRTWVTQQAKVAGLAALFPVYEMGLDLFQRIVARDPQIKQRLLDTMLDYVERERGGQTIPRGLAKTISGMWHDISPLLYREDFEEPMLDASRLYYARLAQSLVGPGSEYEGAARGGEPRTCAAFFAEVEKRLADESARAEHYLHESTAPKLKAMVRPEKPTKFQLVSELRLL